MISLILPTDDAGNPTSDAPSAVDVSGSKTGQLYGVYLQDEWSITGVGVGAPQYGQCRAFFGGIREVF